ncbi:MAG TPA: NADAR family protein [Candidatus Ornithomonoglobus merdipullorum]|uniref:NADAR family protein n=1 Tax=Candidatus Ornithomonoglobus merdipullorum TaxID=2840895 RepID=A0A9D1M9Q6_9FIRM|nr:NADAR family protein [Candidatus Ornithomonoglobus merdipullorum]
MNVICFHDPDEENGYLSNWFFCRFTVDNLEFSSAEQFMMYKKAMCFNDSDTSMKILKTDNAAEIKKLGRLVVGYNENHWNGVRQIIVYEGLLQKFYQNKDLKNRLLDTGDSLLAECAVNDRIWGIGLSMHDPERFCRTKWKGENLLGYTLMAVRDKLRNTNPTY